MVAYCRMIRGLDTFFDGGSGRVAPHVAKRWLKFKHPSFNPLKNLHLRSYVKRVVYVTTSSLNNSTPSMCFVQSHDMSIVWSTQSDCTDYIVNIFFAYLEKWTERDISRIQCLFEVVQAALGSWGRGLHTSLFSSNSEHFDFWAYFDPIDHLIITKFIWMVSLGF